MKTHWKSCFALFLITLLSGCASASGGGGEPATEFESNLGRVLGPPLSEGLNKILPKYHLDVRREELQYSTLYWETEWQRRDVTAEERTSGITDARQRAVIQGRRIGDTMGGGAEYRVTFTAQNQVRTETNTEWHPAPAPPEFFSHWRRVASDLELEISAGIRR